MSSAGRPAVVLVRPQEEGNIGAVARAMANMGLTRLLLVEPAPELGAVARARAVGAGAILDAAERRPSFAEAVAPFERVVGTTSSRARALPAPVLAPRELPALLASDPAGTAAALVFGPEASGLTNDELARCSVLVRVPCSPRQPTLNLAQAVLVLAYELHLSRLADGRRRAGASARVPPAATAAELEGLLAHVSRTLAAVGFARDDTFAGVLRDVRRLAARAGLSHREVRILRGVCRRVERRLERVPRPTRSSREAPAGGRGGG